MGSLLRPPELHQARAEYSAGRLDAEALRDVEDWCIDEVIALQRDLGLQSLTDGELRRTSWHMDFIYQLEGIDRTDEKLLVHFHNAEGDLDFESAALSVHDRVRLGHTIFGDAFRYLRDRAAELAPGMRPKLTIPSPSMVHYRGGRAAISRDVNPDLEAFWADLTVAYAEQVRRLGELGCTYLQLDDTSLAYLNDPAQRVMVAEQGGDAEHQHEQYIRIINAALKNRPDGMRVTTHMCRGNFRSSWVAQGSYDFVAEGRGRPAGARTCRHGGSACVLEARMCAARCAPSDLEAHCGNQCTVGRAPDSPVRGDGSASDAVSGDLHARVRARSAGTPARVPPRRRCGTAAPELRRVGSSRRRQASGADRSGLRGPGPGP